MSILDRVAKFQAPDPYPYPGMEMAPQKVKPFVEIGVTGIQRTRGVGFLFEEWLRQLSVNQSKKYYREMRDNDAVIGAMFFALEMILRRAEWSVEAEGGAKGEKSAEFVDQCVDDMSHTWEDFIAECVNMFAFGFSLFETVYKRRNGPDGKKASKYDDGLIGWRKMAPRAQETIQYWIWDDEGGLQGAVQLAAPDYRTVPIPIEKLLLFRTTSLKNSPEGRSILRNCFVSYFTKRRIQEVEAIGIERDLCGIPTLSVTAELLASWGEGDIAAGRALAQKLVTAVRVDDQHGLVLPLAYDANGKEQIKFELVKSGGMKQNRAGDAIKRYNEDMLNTILAGFIQFGQTEHGARSLHMSATQIFANAIQAFMDSVAAVMNRIAIPRLLALNGMDLKYAPKLVPGEIGVRDLEEVGNFLLKTSQAGFMMAGPETTAYLRSIAHLPEEPESETNMVPLDQDQEQETSVPKPNVTPPAGPPVKPNGAAKPKVNGYAAQTDQQAQEDLEGAG